MTRSRIFITNLSKRTTKQDLRQLLQEYGRVELIELKTKENIVDESQAKVIAFVTLKTDDVDYCINYVNSQSLHGSQLRAAQAKEPFLDRLKREREGHVKISNENPHVVGTTSNNFTQNNQQNTRSVFHENEELNFDEVLPELLISKKCAARSMQNGKIVIQQNYDATALHVIENNKKISKKLDVNSTVADQKRKESLKKMKYQYHQKILAIQQALAGVQEVQLSRKIKFSDSIEDGGEDEVTEKKKGNKNKSKVDIFACDADEDENDDIANISLPHHKGKKGEEMLKIQSKQSYDPRFKMYDKFVVDDEDKEKNDTNGDTEEVENERSRQMGILEQVVVRKIYGSAVDGAGANATANNKRMLRFDPFKNEHMKYLQQMQPVQQHDNQKPKKKQKNSFTQPGITSAPTTALVSKEVFYFVTDTLQQSLKTRGDGFSLLNMFSNVESAEQQRGEQLQQISNERIIVNKADKFRMDTLNPFRYDSSSSENENDGDEDSNAAITQPAKQQQQLKSKKVGKSKKSYIIQETFFMPKNDVRLKEGAKLFKYNKTLTNVENYEGVRNRLKLLIEAKISKTKKQLAATGVKTHKTKKARKMR